MPSESMWLISPWTSPLRAVPCVCDPHLLRQVFLTVLLHLTSVGSRVPPPLCFDSVKSRVSANPKNPEKASRFTYFQPILGARGEESGQEKCSPGDEPPLRPRQDLNRAATHLGDVPIYPVIHANQFIQAKYRLGVNRLKSL